MNTIERLAQELLTLRKLKEIESKPIDKELIEKVIKELGGEEK